LTAHASGGRWTPDGTHVIFSGDGKRLGIYVVKADGTAPERLVLDLSGRRGAHGRYGTPADGKYVYFTWDEDLGDLWTMNVGSGKPERRLHWESCS
jgi:Tol biopolymer transport system component